jgi:hypothetical protein
MVHVLLIAPLNVPLDIVRDCTSRYMDNASSGKLILPVSIRLPGLMSAPPDYSELIAITDSEVVAISVPNSHDFLIVISSERAIATTSER